MMTQQTEKRSLDQFLSDQQKFLQQASQKKTNLKNDLEKIKQIQHTGMPKINNKVIPSQQNQKEAAIPVHERLYQLNAKKATSNSELSRDGLAPEKHGSSVQFQTAVDNEQSTFRPQINEKSKNLIRKGKVGDHLYMDAKMRKERQMRLQTERQMQSMQKSEFKYTSSKSEQHVAAKFIKEYEGVINEVLGNDDEPAIDYIRLGEILKRLNFLH